MTQHAYHTVSVQSKMGKFVTVDSKFLTLKGPTGVSMVCGSIVYGKYMLWLCYLHVYLTHKNLNLMYNYM